MNILYLEDNPTDVEFVRRGLNRERKGVRGRGAPGVESAPGFTLEIAPSLAEAYSMLEGLETDIARGAPPRFDLALLDLQLPDGSGLEVLARIRDRALPLGVVVLTGSGDEESVVAALKAGADDYVSKQLDFWSRLPETLERALDHFRSQSALRVRPIRLLYVEPNRADAEFTRRHFADNAPYIRLEALDSPSQALERLPLAGPVTDVDMILLDFNLPGMDAFEMFKEVNLNRKLSLPVLIITGHGTEDLAIQAVKLGAMDYLTKTSGYLERLPFAVETAFYRSLAAKEKAALRESEARLRTIIETEPEGVHLVDSQGSLTEMNPAGLAMLEAGSLADARGRPLLEYVCPEYREAFAELFNRVFRGETAELEFEIVGLKGTRRWMDTHAAPMRGPDGGIESLLGITRDITGRKLSEANARQQEKMSALGQLAGGIAHDFNNQLAAILGYAELLGARISDKESKYFIETIIQATRRSGDLTRSLLAFSRQGQYQNVPIDLHNLIHETANMLGRSIDKRIVVNLRLNAPRATITGDPSQIQNMLLNLALNARDAMPEGGTLEFATEEVALKAAGSFNLDRPNHGPLGDRFELPPGDYLHLSVRDTGYGMSAEVKRHLFEPFFTTKPIGKGTGMGLASVIGTVGLHHGEVYAESEVGCGSTFHIHLPVSEEKAEEWTHLSLLPMSRKLCILVVDDEEMLRGVMAEMLGTEGHRVLKAESGRDALAIYRSRWREIDMVILDMVMPDMSGGETLGEILKINPLAKVLLTSGYSPNGEPQSVLERGAVGFLNKPFEKSRLDAMVARAVQA